MEMQGYLGVRDSVRRGSSLKGTQRRWPSSESRATWLGDARLANATNLWELQTAHTLTERGEMAHKVALINMKGGVGKSTLAVNVAWEMATDPYCLLLMIWDTSKETILRIQKPAQGKGEEAGDSGYRMTNIGID